MNRESNSEINWETFAHEADIGVRGSGATVGDAFAGAAMAMTSAICDPARVAPREAVSIECAAPDEEALLVDWLNALVYEMAIRRMLFSRFEVVIEVVVEVADEFVTEFADAGQRHLRATAWGEALDVARHQPAAEVKGATFCELKVGCGSDGHWLAQCIVDV